MAYIRITSPRSQLFESVLEARKIHPKDGAITKHDDLLFKPHEYEEVVVLTQKEHFDLKSELSALRLKVPLPTKEKKKVKGRSFLVPALFAVIGALLIALIYR